VLDFAHMNSLALIIALTVALAAAAQTVETGSICGTVLDENGQPAPNVRVSATSLVCCREPQSRSDDAGHYCLSHLRCGHYLLSADEEKLGYPNLRATFYTTAPFSERSDAIAVISVKHPQAELTFRIPYKAGFLRIQPSDAATGKPVPGMTFSLRVKSDPDLRSIGGTRPASNDQVLPQQEGDLVSPREEDDILLPPNEDILLKVSAPGYREWPYDGLPGYLINLLPGERATIDVPLQPQ
jgi:hypothetical protein